MSKFIPAHRQATNPSIYHAHHEAFADAGNPKTAQAWIERAEKVGEILGKDAAQRDIENKSPFAEVALLKSSGLLKLLGPRKYGGGGQPWSVGYKCVRAVARGDGSLGQLLGYHLLWSTTANVVGTEEQAEQVQKVIIENNWFVGGAVNPRDSDLNITHGRDGNTIVFNGSKTFSTGGVISDLTVLEGVLEGTDLHIFTLVKTQQPGLQFLHNWDALGMRLTESGGVKIDNVVVPWSDALGWSPVTKQPIPEVLNIPYASLLLPTIQLIFSNFYLGIAQGAIKAAGEYTRNFTRAWPFGGDNKAKPTEEWYVLERYGDWAAHLEALDALLDRLGDKVDKLIDDAKIAGGAAVNGVNGTHTNGVNGTHSSHGDLNEITSPALKGRATITARARGEISAQIAHGKVVATDTGLKVTSGIHEVMGSRSTGAKYRLDRFFRDIRTHSLHDPVAYKRREVGEYQLLDKIPEPTWYT